MGHAVPEGLPERDGRYLHPRTAPPGSAWTDTKNQAYTNPSEAFYALTKSDAWRFDLDYYGAIIATANPRTAYKFAEYNWRLGTILNQAVQIGNGLNSNIVVTTWASQLYPIPDFLIPSHAYAVLGFANGKLRLYNPWGVDSPKGAISGANDGVIEITNGHSWCPSTTRSSTRRHRDGVHPDSPCVNDRGARSLRRGRRSDCDRPEHLLHELRGFQGGVSGAAPSWAKNRPGIAPSPVWPRAAVRPTFIGRTAALSLSGDSPDNQGRCGRESSDARRNRRARPGE